MSAEADGRGGWRRVPPSPQPREAGPRGDGDSKAQVLMEHDVAWALETVGQDASRVRVYELDSEAGPLAYAVLTVQPAAFVYALGEIVLRSVKTERLRLVRGVVDLGEHGDASDAASWPTELLRTIHADGEGRPVFLQGVPVGSPLHLALADPGVKRVSRVLPHGRPRARYTVDLPQDFATYLAHLGQSTRESSRRKMRRLARFLGEEPRLRRFSTEDEVDLFLEHAVPISRRTYQWRLLGTGLRDESRLRRLFRFSAARGWWCSYVLYCKDEPVAFIVGHLYKGTYYYVDPGFDPEWGKWSVGVVSLLGALKDLLGHTPRPRRFDFLYGADEYKRLYSNRQELEADFYLLPRGWRGGIRYWSLRGMNTVSEGLGQLLERLRLKQWVKTLLRRAAVAGPDQAGRADRG